MQYEYHKDNVIVKIIGGFKIEELGKEYVLCTFDDNPSSKKIEMIIFEVKDNELIDIPEEETEMVLMFYKSIRNDILKGDNHCE